MLPATPPLAFCKDAQKHSLLLAQLPTNTTNTQLFAICAHRVSQGSGVCFRSLKDAPFANVFTSKAKNLMIYYTAAYNSVQPFEKSGNLCGNFTGVKIVSSLLVVMISHTSLYVNQLSSFCDWRCMPNTQWLFAFRLTYQFLHKQFDMHRTSKDLG